jgi:predicted RNA-binding protein YlxR (DUF448 family)
VIDPSAIAEPAGENAEPRGPLRRCLVTGETRERSALLRFVVGPDGEIVPDVAARLPGRGLWLTPRRDIVERAVAKRLFARAARRSVAAPPGLADRVEALLATRCRDMIGLARRAGRAVGGFEKVREAVEAGTAGLILFALDGSPQARRKIAAVGRELPLVRVLTAAELGAAFGRDHVVQASLGRGRLCAQLFADAVKIAGFRCGAVVEQAAQRTPGRLARQDMVLE